MTDDELRARTAALFGSDGTASPELRLSPSLLHWPACTNNPCTCGATGALLFTEDLPVPLYCGRCQRLVGWRRHDGSSELLGCVACSPLLPRLPAVMPKDPEVGIGIRFIRQYDATADQWPPPFDSTTKEAQRAYNALQSQWLDGPAPRLRWWQRLAFWLYWNLYDRWTYRTRDDVE